MTLVLLRAGDPFICSQGLGVIMRLNAQRRVALVQLQNGLRCETSLEQLAAMVHALDRFEAYAPAA